MPDRGKEAEECEKHNQPPPLSKLATRMRDAREILFQPLFDTQKLKLQE